jgi:hypothetical protein
MEKAILKLDKEEYSLRKMTKKIGKNHAIFYYLLASLNLLTTKSLSRDARK